MLPFRVIQIEQHGALQQKAGTPFLPEICNPEFSLITQSSSARKHAKSDRQIPELDHAVTLGKQTGDTCSNCQKPEKCLRAFSAPIRFLSARNLAGSNSGNVRRSTRENEPFPQSAGTTSTRFWPKSRSCRKKMIKRFLPGARTAYCDRTNFDQFSTKVGIEKP
jgi:hypothetical protein